MHFPLFEKKRKTYLKIFANHIPSDGLDPAVFEVPPTGGNPVLTQAAQAQITSDVAQICSMERLLLDACYVTGPICEPSRNRKADSEIHVLVKLSKNQLANIEGTVSLERLLKLCKMFSDKMLSGTQHPLVYEPFTDPERLKSSKALYDINRNEWIKPPLGLE